MALFLGAGVCSLGLLCKLRGQCPWTGSLTYFEGLH